MHKIKGLKKIVYMIVDKLAVFDQGLHFPSLHRKAVLAIHFLYYTATNLVCPKF